MLFRSINNINIEVSRASQTQKIPQVGLPQREPVIIEIKQNTEPTGAILFAINGRILTLKIKVVIDAIPINPKQPMAIKDEGTCTYIILTEFPCTESGGEVISALISPTIITEIIIIIKTVKIFLFNKRILFGKKFLSIKIHYS